MSKQETTEFDRNCEVLVLEIRNARKLNKIIKELESMIPEFKHRGTPDQAESAVCNIRELFEQAVNVLFFEKKCPFVNFCLLQAGYEISNFLERNPGRNYQAAIDRFIAKEQIGE